MCCLALLAVSAGFARRTTRATRAQAHAATAWCVWTNARADPVLWIRSGPGTGYATIGHIPYQESFVGECGKQAWIELQSGGYANAAYVS